MIFTLADYRRLHKLFTPHYAGYKPSVREAPNGDGQVDQDKCYLHVALKYDPPEWAVNYLARAHFEACRIAEALDCAAIYYPRVEDGTLRVLEYPEGASSAPHIDFDLFTVSCYRSSPEEFQRLDPVDPLAEAIDPAVHIGEIGELVGLGKATRHQVLPRAIGKQYSIVYFAMPGHDVVLPAPGWPTVGDWLKERYARSRVPA